MTQQEMASLFKALSDVNRLRIVELVAASDDICACKVLDDLDVTQPTLSHHMKVLCSCGLVKARKEGKWMHYSLNHDFLEVVKLYLERFDASNS